MEGIDNIRLGSNRKYFIQMGACGKLDIMTGNASGVKIIRYCNKYYVTFIKNFNRVWFSFLSYFRTYSSVCLWTQSALLSEMFSMP